MIALHVYNDHCVSVLLSKLIPESAKKMTPKLIFDIENKNIVINRTLTILQSVKPGEESLTWAVAI